MENQHSHIKGYRELDADEIRLMNDIKEQAEYVRMLIKKVTSAYEYECPLGRDTPEDQYKEMQRCRDLAEQRLQEGFMWLIRSVARPETF